MQLLNMARRGVLFGANALVVLIMMLGHMEPIGALRVCVVLAAAGFFLVYKGKASCVMEDIATYVCVDLVAYVALWFDKIIAAYDAKAISTMFEKISTNDFGILLMIGVGLLIAGFIWKPWLMGVGGGCVGSALVLGTFATGGFKHIEFAGNGKIVFTVYVFSAAFWTLCLYMSEMLQPKRKTLDKILSLIVLAVSVIIAVGCSAYTNAIAPEIAKNMYALPVEGFAWWRVLVCAIVLGGMAYALSNRKSTGSIWWSTDSIVLFGCIVLVLGMRVLMDYYFVFSWVFMLALVVAVYRCIFNAKSGKTTFGFDALTCFAVELVVFIVLSSMLGQGLVPSAIVTCVILLAAYVLRDKRGKYLANANVWVFLVVAFVVEAVAWLGVRHNLAIEYVRMAAILVFGIATLLILNKHRAGDVPAPRKWDIVICCCVALLCVLSMHTSVNVETKPAADNVKATLSAARESNPITGATYEWVNAFGEVVAPKTPLPVGESNLPIQADHLVVRATDSAGATIRYDYYYASWMHNFAGSRQQVADAAAAASKENKK